MYDCMKPLSTTQQEQDKLFDEQFTTAQVMFEGEDISAEDKEIKAYLHTRDLAIEEAVRAELVEQVKEELEAVKTSFGSIAIKVGMTKSLHDVLALLTTSPSR